MDNVATRVATITQFSHNGAPGTLGSDRNITVLKMTWPQPLGWFNARTSPVSELADPGPRGPLKWKPGFGGGWGRRWGTPRETLQ